MAHGHSPRGGHNQSPLGVLHAVGVAFFVAAFAVHEMGVAAFLFILAIGGIIVAAACER